MCHDSCHGHTHRYNARYLAASVVGTLVIYAVRWVAADEHDQHLRWRCPVPLSAVIFAGGQLSGVAAVALTDGSLTLRAQDEPPARCPLQFYVFVSITSAVMLCFVLLWTAGIYSKPRCLSGSEACLRLRANLEQTGWITAALVSLWVCQLVGAVAASRSLCCPPAAAQAALATSSEVIAIDAALHMRPVIPARPVFEAHEGVVTCQPVPPNLALTAFGDIVSPNAGEGVVEGVVIRASPVTNPRY